MDTTNLTVAYDAAGKFEPQYDSCFPPISHIDPLPTTSWIDEPSVNIGPVYDWTPCLPTYDSSTAIFTEKSGSDIVADA